MVSAAVKQVSPDIKRSPVLQIPALVLRYTVHS